MQNFFRYPFKIIPIYTFIPSFRGIHLPLITTMRAYNVMPSAPGIHLSLIQTIHNWTLKCNRNQYADYYQKIFHCDFLEIYT